MRYWINGKPLPDLTKELPPGKQWVPTVAIMDTALDVTLNPFCVSSDPALSRDLIAQNVADLNSDKVVGGRRTLPACLSEPTIGIQSRFLSEQLTKYLFAYNIP
jgi:hypothetical protein